MVICKEFPTFGLSDDWEMATGMLFLVILLDWGDMFVADGFFCYDEDGFGEALLRTCDLLAYYLSWKLT